MLCVSTQIFNHIKIFNLFEKGDISKILDMGLCTLEHMNLRCILPFLANCVKSVLI